MAAPSYGGITTIINYRGTGIAPSTEVPSGVTQSSGRSGSGQGIQFTHSAIATLVGGTSQTFTSVNLSNSQDFIVFVYRYLNRPFNNPLGNLSTTNGMRIAIMNNLTNYRQWIIDSDDTIYEGIGYNQDVPITIQLNPGSLPNDATLTTGIFDTTSIARVGIWWPQTITSSQLNYICALYSGRHAICTAGEVGNGITLSGLAAYLSTLFNTQWASTIQAGYTAIKYFTIPIQYGNGSTASYSVDSTSEVIQWRIHAKNALYSSTYKDPITQVNDNFLGLNFITSASDNFQLSFKTFQAHPNDKIKFTVDSSSNIAATLDFNACVFVRFGNIVLRKPLVMNSCTWINSDTINLNNCTFNTVSVLSSTATNAVAATTTSIANNSLIRNATNGLSITASGDYSNLGFTLQSCTRGVNITTAVTNGSELDLTALSFTSNTTDIFWEGTTGSITITVSQLGLTTGSNGGTINLITPTVSYIRGVSNVPVGVSVGIFKRSKSKFADRFQFTLASGNNSGNSTIVINETIPLDTPTTGFIRVFDPVANTEDRYQYSSWSGSTFTLSTTLSTSYSSGIGAYVGYIDVLGAGSSNVNVSLPYVVDRNVVLRVRLGSGVNAILDITQDFTIGESDITIPLSPISDIYNNL